MPSMLSKSLWRPRLSLAQKLACLTAGLGLLMTSAFTLLNATQMRTETTRNYHDMLEAIMQVRESLLHQQYTHLQEWMDARERHDLAVGQGTGAAAPAVLQRLLDENTGILPLQARLVFLSRAGEVLAPAALRQQSLAVEVSPAMLEEAATTRRIMTWSGPRGQYLYRVFYFAPQKWYVACLLPLDALNSMLTRRTQQMLLTGFALTLAGLLLALWLGRRLTAPLRALDKAACILPELDMSVEQTADGALQGLPPLPLRRGDEVGALARSFDHMVRQLHDNVRKMLLMSQEQTRLQSELQLARAIQDGMLPREFPQRDALDVHGLVLPAREVGGDFFDVFMLDDDTLCFAVGDVSDKGVPAALFMSMILCLTRTLLRQGRGLGGSPDPAAVLGSVNKALCRDNPRSMFATMIVGVLDVHSGRLSFANAGHPPPLRLRRGDSVNAPLGVEELLSPREMVAGAFEEVLYTTNSSTLTPGDRILLYTDGVTEALRADGQRFGHLQGHLEGLPHDSAEANKAVIEKIQLFTCESPQADDITLLNFFWGHLQGEKNNIY